MQSLKAINLILSVLFCITILTGSNNNIFAQSGSASAEAVPSDSAATAGGNIDVEIIIDVSGVQAPDNLLGSFDGVLIWDATILNYQSNSGSLAGFTGVVNTDSIALGKLIFNGANATGAGGRITVLMVSFSVLRTDFESMELNLQFDAMAAAITFANLLPILNIDNGVITDVTENTTSDRLPETFDLLPNYPNPFNPETIINYQIQEQSHVTLKIYNFVGQELFTLVDEKKDRGFYSVNFGARNLASGVYLYTLKAGEFIETRKMVLLR